jgi:NADH-quinone oxidoreductase subunit G
VLLNIEPEIDVANVQAAKKALLAAQTVIAMTAYESEGLLELADVLLPITPFTETSGSFISMEGRLQSFHGVVRPLGEARPAWKVLRVLGNMLGVTGFEYNASEEVLSDAIDQAELANRFNSRLTQSIATGEKQEALIRVGGVSIYSTDAISRRSAPLQATTHAQVPVAKVNAGTLAKLGVTEGSVQLAAVGGDAITVTVAVDNQLPENVVYLPVHPANKALGNMMATVEFKRG